MVTQQMTRLPTKDLFFWRLHHGRLDVRLVVVVAACCKVPEHGLDGNGVANVSQERHPEHCAQPFTKGMLDGMQAARDTWQDGGGRECRFVSIDKERKQNAVNFKRDFLPHAAEEILGCRRGSEVDKR